MINKKLQIKEKKNNKMIVSAYDNFGETISKDYVIKQNPMRKKFHFKNNFYIPEANQI